MFLVSMSVLEENDTFLTQCFVPLEFISMDVFRSRKRII